MVEKKIIFRRVPSDDPLIKEMKQMEHHSKQSRLTLFNGIQYDWYALTKWGHSQTIGYKFVQRRGPSFFHSEKPNEEMYFIREQEVGEKRGR